MNLFDHAARIEKAALTVCQQILGRRFSLNPRLQTISEEKAITGDLGGKASTKEYTNAIIQKLDRV